MNRVISWLFLVYFIVLYAERIQSLIRTGRENLFSSSFLIYVNVVAIISLVAATVMLIAFNSTFWLSLFNGAVVADYRMLSITAGVILVSGMVHTEHTIAPVQFGAYGALIVAMVLKTIIEAQTGKDLLPLWYSLAFLTVLSMAIPVVYPTQMKTAPLFVAIEAVVSLALVLYFTLMLVQLMQGNGTNLLWIIPTLIVLIGDALIVGMQWKEGPNTFVMIFGIITVVMYVVGKIII